MDSQNISWDKFSSMFTTPNTALKVIHKWLCSFFHGYLPLFLVTQIWTPSVSLETTLAKGPLEAEPFLITRFKSQTLIFPASLVPKALTYDLDADLQADDKQKWWGLKICPRKGVGSSNCIKYFVWGLCCLVVITWPRPGQSAYPIILTTRIGSRIDRFMSKVSPLRCNPELG